jgi:DNA-binding transcriptional LysR family regulator
MARCRSLRPLFEAPRLTETGLWFRQIAQDLLAEVARVSGEAQAIAEANSATLRFAVTHALSFIFILRWLRALEAQTTIGPIQLLSDVYKRWEALLLQSQVQFVLSHAHEQCMCRTSHHRRANSSRTCSALSVRNSWTKRYENKTVGNVPGASRFQAFQSARALCLGHRRLRAFARGWPFSDDRLHPPI